jgi:hypothetical protein
MSENDSGNSEIKRFQNSESEGSSGFQPDDSQPNDIDGQFNFSQATSSTNAVIDNSQALKVISNDSYIGNEVKCDDMFISDEEDEDFEYNQQYTPSQKVTDGLQGSQKASQELKENDYDK